MVVFQVGKNIHIYIQRKRVQIVSYAAVTVIWYTPSQRFGSPIANFHKFEQKFAPKCIAKVYVFVPWPL